MKLLPYFLAAFVLFSCKNETPKNDVTLAEKTPEIGLITQNAMVVSAREEASRIGSDILEKGGNAFDAMIATEMALAVCFPYAGNLGGGGFIVYRTQYGELGSFDYREKAPMAASRDMYLDEDGNFMSDKSKIGGLAVGVPGTVAGIFAVHEKLGSLPMEVILQPVIDLARNGYILTEDQAIRLNLYAPEFEVVNGESSIYTVEFKSKALFKNEALAQTLERIAANGRSEFYGGETAKKLIAFLKKHNGIMTLKDLEAYEAEWREPVTYKYKDLNVISMAPPSSGGICLAQILKMVESYPLKEYGHNSVKAIQVITEAERRAFADRSYYLGDPDFVNIPTETLISENYLNGRMDNFSEEKATVSTEMSYGNIEGFSSMQQESTETTHYSIIDQFGNAIAVTTTLNAAFGSKLYVKDLGFFLNNEMDDFSAKPGEPNMFGLIGGEANAIAPQKRMLSSMTPTLIEKNDIIWMSLGTPGGAMIITSVLQTILNVYEFDMSMQDAVNAPRFHHQWLPDVIQFEPESFNKSILKVLADKGYNIDEVNAPVIGKVDAILVRPDGSLEGGADRRGDDTAIGF
jgi:gamma-glutamyltranspeptidase/glutathione hydrolase